MLPRFARQMIESCVRERDADGNHRATQNQLLEEVLEDVKARWPEHFHTDETLKRRVFFNQPKTSIPCAFYVKPLRKDQLI
jgi:hypothetical protein